MSTATQPRPAPATPLRLVPQPQRKAAIYVRVSTEKQEREGTSLGSQEAACRAYATAQGYQVDEAHIYREVHTGSELYERQRLAALRDLARRARSRRSSATRLTASRATRRTCTSSMKSSSGPACPCSSRPRSSTSRPWAS
jgi:predicted site-specific integrase-resolvase